ncbi:MAG: beta-ketoacyl synthase chain length factor [Pseudomonadales bacterium]|nr:beta-ketoacyl synthase chain length factor [Pseudomonadales bacterium]
MNTLGISVDAWAAWAPGIDSPNDWNAWLAGDSCLDEGVKPNVSFVPPMYRRRLSLLGKMAVLTAQQCVDQYPIDSSLRLVFASRYGENARTVGILNNIVDDGSVSPAAFSLSVHNAIAGIFSIIHNATEPSVSVSAGQETFSAAWIEAEQILWSQMENADRVLLVYYDEPLTGDLTRFTDDIQIPFSISLMLSKSQSNGESICLQNKRALDSSDSSLNESKLNQPLSFLRLLLSPEQMISTTTSNWVWVKNSANA